MEASSIIFLLIIGFAFTIYAQFDNYVELRKIRKILRAEGEEMIQIHETMNKLLLRLAETLKAFEEEAEQR